MIRQAAAIRLVKFLALGIVGRYKEVWRRKPERTFNLQAQPMSRHRLQRIYSSDWRIDESRSPEFDDHPGARQIVRAVSRPHRDGMLTGLQSFDDEIEVFLLGIQNAIG